MAGIGRVTSYTLQQLFLRDAAKTQSELYAIQTQAASGQKATAFSGLGSDVSQFLDLENRIDRSDLYIKTSKVIEGRLNQTDTVLNSILDTANSLKNLITLRRNSATGDDVAYETQLDGIWKQLVGQLNTSLEGRYLFSGTRTDVPAVDSENFPTLEHYPTPDDGYYTGSTEDITIRLDESIEMKYNVRADNPAFQKIFAGLAMAKQYGTVSGENPDMAKAFDMVSEGVDDITGLRAEVNSNNIVVKQNAERLDTLKLYWQGLKEDIGNADLVALSTQVAINQGVLQASFQVFSRISALKLSDYLS